MDLNRDVILQLRFGRPWNAIRDQFGTFKNLMSKMDFSTLSKLLQHYVIML